MNRRNRRKKIKREIFELSILLQLEKEKYPSWFQNQYISDPEEIIKKLQSYNDDELDKILEQSDRGNNQYFKYRYDEAIEFVKDSINGWQAQYLEIQSKLKAEINQFNIRKIQVSEQNTQLLSE